MLGLMADDNLMACKHQAWWVDLYLAVDDIEVLVAEVLQDFVDVLFFIKQGECMQQIAPATYNAQHVNGKYKSEHLLTSYFWTAVSQKC